MSFYWLYSSYSLLLFPLPSLCSFCCKPFFLIFFNVLSFSFCLFFFIFSLHLSNLLVLFPLSICCNGFLLDFGVISLSSVLPAPLQTFCCTHAPPSTHSCSLSLSSHVPTILSLTEMKPLPFSLSRTYVHWLVLCELLFSLRDTHSCSLSMARLPPQMLLHP